MDIDPELLEEFKTEANEHLATVEDEVLALEQGGPDVDEDTVNHLFRALHTVKGGGNVMGFTAIAELGHALEDVVGLIREGGLVVAKPVSDALLAGIDKLKVLVNAPGDEAVEMGEEVAALQAVLEAPSSGDEAAEPPPALEIEVDPELLEEFAAEVDEHLATVEDDVLALEGGGADVDEETVNHLFRALHTVKGGGNLMGFTLVTELAHALENAVGLIREGELVPGKAVSDVLLAGIDKLKLLVKDPAGGSILFDDEVAALERLVSEGPDAGDAPGEPAAAPAPSAEPPPPPELDVDPELLEEFAAEVNEHLATVEDDVLALEKAGDDVDEETVNHLFRALHTVKGGGNLMGFTLVAELAHALENVVGLIREGELTPAKSVSDALLRGIDKLKLLVSDPVNASAPIREELLALEHVVSGEDAPSAAVAGTSPQALPPASAAPAPEAAPPAAPPDRGEEAPGPAKAPAAKGKATRQPKVEGDQALRISLVLLDKLMNLATELVLVRNQNRQAVESGDLEQLATISQRLNVVTSELQAGIMQTRMRPVGATFTKFRRAVRDLARKLGKEVELEIIGSDVELDKTIIEAIGDPLTHLVRNAVDHGVELPEERRRKGKSPVGHVRLWAYHQAGQVNIEISDDGKGMDAEKLKRAAVEKGILRPEQTRLLSKREAINLIFEPGFSTASGVTDVSGRGVGMDVVKASFQRLGGVVDLSSEVDKGSTTTIKLPLTLAIVPVLIVAVGDHRFAVPEVNIHEVVWLRGEEAVTGIERVDDQEVFWLREQLLPVLRLADCLEAGSPRSRGEPTVSSGAFEALVPGSGDSPVGPAADGVELVTSGEAQARAGADPDVYIIVLEAGSEQFGLLVDTIIDTEEIVVKPLHQQLKDCAMYAGTTVLGDGNIAMILDVAAVADIGQIRYANVEKTMLPSQDSQAEHRAALFFSIGGTERFALPLFFITRVEEIDPGEVQIANEREYWDFRGSLIPLLRVEETISRVRAQYPEEKLYIIIPKCRRPFGIIAAHILDAIDVPNQIDSTTIDQAGIIGSQLIDGRLTLFLDPFALIEQVEPSWFATEETAEVRRVLLVDDSPFSRLLVASYLHGTGISITTAEDGEGGLQALAEGTFDCVISDIEMPVMNGYEFARAVREQPRYMDLPLLAISGASGHIIDQALDAGFSDFASKFDRTALVAAVKRLCFGAATVV